MNAYGGGIVCPRCGNPHSAPVKFTWWGGLIGPRMFSHVKCQGCGFAYNGKTGRPNTTAITIYVLVGVVIGIAALILISMSK